MRAWVIALVAAASVGGATGVAAQAQEDGGWEVIRRGDSRDRDDDRRDRDRRTDDRRDSRWDDILRGDDDRDRRDGRVGRDGRNGGPPFCRNGAGHPVHGRQWCRDKGWGLGNDNDRWSTTRWPDVVLRAPRREGRLDRGGLADVLGDVVFGRVERRVRSSGERGTLTGEWFRDSYRSGVMVNIAGRPVAQILDLNSDGRADVIRFRD